MRMRTCGDVYLRSNAYVWIGEGSVEGGWWMVATFRARAGQARSMSSKEDKACWRMEEDAGSSRLGLAWLTGRA